jgi:hypothetical protein
MVLVYTRNTRCCKITCRDSLEKSASDGVRLQTVKVPSRRRLRLVYNQFPVSGSGVIQEYNSRCPGVHVRADPV